MQLIIRDLIYRSPLHDIFQVRVLPGTQTGKEIDLKAEPLIITVSNPDYRNITEITADMINSGKAQIDYDNASGECTLNMAMFFADGSTLSVNVSGVLEQAVEETENLITVNGSAEPVRASFYMKDSGSTYLYFMPAEIDNFYEDLYNVSYYLWIVVPDELMDGSALDASDVDSGITIYYVYDYSESMLMEPTGTFSVTADSSDETRYTVNADLTFEDGTTVALSFDGNVRSVDDVEEQANEFTYDGATQAIQSALVDKSDPDIWYVYLSPIGGLEDVSEYEDPFYEAIKITLPAEAFEMGSCGFSTYKDIMKFEHNGESWQYPGTGSITELSLDGDQLTIGFTTYGDLEGYYSGTAVIVE